MNSTTDDARILTPQELLAAAAEKADREIEKAMAVKRQHEEELRRLHDAFVARDIDADVRHRVNTAVRSASEQGSREVLMLRFPSDWCTDGGRAINNDDPDWPRTLNGFAQRAYAYWDANLRPLGYNARARIVDYPGGKPGDVGLYLIW
jgi:hypothetical protein